jgi:hypothetical protein
MSPNPRNRKLILLLVSALFLCACAYIVLPEEDGDLSGLADLGWSAVATQVGQSAAGDLRVELTILNNTGDWSAMQAAPGKPAALKTGDGKSVPCETVLVGTGGHRLAPGFQIRGYTAGTKAEPSTRLLYVECAGQNAAAGSVLSIDYSYVTGQYNYYYPENNKVDATLEVDLDAVAADLEYPLAQPVEGLVQQPGTGFTAINDVVLTLTGVERTDGGLKFSWQTANPGEYPSYVHIGIPPVIGEDGILYGLYESPDLASAPITPAGDKAEWVTEADIPAAVHGSYIMLSVETGKQRLFANYAVDVTGY